MTDTHNIETLQAKVAALRLALGNAEDELRDAKIAASGVSIGDIVIGIGRQAGEHRVTEINTSFNPPWLKGNPKREDGSFGTFGTLVRNLYGDWKRPDK